MQSLSVFRGPLRTAERGEVSLKVWKDASFINVRAFRICYPLARSGERGHPSAQFNFLRINLPAATHLCSLEQAKNRRLRRSSESGKRDCGAFEGTAAMPRYKEIAMSSPGGQTQAQRPSPMLGRSITVFETLPRSSRPLVRGSCAQADNKRWDFRFLARNLAAQRHRNQERQSRTSWPALSTKAKAPRFDVTAPRPP